ncbi:hypothetical protein MD484_g4922, partial [Candolleomyces efflorescens]
MEERIAAHAAQNPTTGPSHHDAENTTPQHFFLSGPVDIARSYGSALSEHAGELVCTCDGQGTEYEHCLRVKEEDVSDQEDVDEVMHSTGPSSMSGISTLPTSSKAKGKSKSSSQVHPSTGYLASSTRQQLENAQAFLPAVGVYYSELAPSGSTTECIPVSNPGPRTSFVAPETAPLFYAVTQHLPQFPENASTASPLPTPAIPLGSPPTPAPFPYESISKPFVTFSLLRHLPRPEPGVQYLKNAKDALNCFVLDLGLPHTGSGRLGWMALLKRHQRRLVQRGLSEAMAPATGEAADQARPPRLKEKHTPSTSRKKPISTIDAENTSPSSMNMNVAVGDRRGQRRAASGAPPSAPPSRPSPQLPAPIPALTKVRISRMRDDVSVSSSHTSPPQNESLPFFALTAALMAIGALNSPSVRAPNTESANKFGTVNHSESPSFLFALSQQALGVWMDSGQPVPAGGKGDEASIKDMRADYLRARLVGVHYLICTANLDSESTNRFCVKGRKQDSPGRQAILLLLGKMVAALRGWGFAEGLLSSSTLSQVDDHPEPMSSSDPSSSSQHRKQGNRKPSSTNERNGDSEDAYSAAEESRLRVLWDVFYYDLTLSDALGVDPLIPASYHSSTPLPSLPVMCSEDSDGSTRHMDRTVSGSERASSKDHEKAKEEIRRMKLEHAYLVHRASLTRLVSGIKHEMALSCCGHTLDRALRMRNSVQEWVVGVPPELRWAFKHGVESSASATGKAVVDSESETPSQGVDSATTAGAYQSRKRVLSCELAFVTQLLVLKLFAPLVSDHLADATPTSKPHPSTATALLHLQASAQAIIHVSRLMYDVWETASRLERPAFRTLPSLKPPLLQLYPLEQLLLDATLVCSWVCCRFASDDEPVDGLGMDRRDPRNSERVQSITMGLSVLERLHETSQRSHPIRNTPFSTQRPSFVDTRLVKLLRKRWEVRNASLPPSESSKRNRDTVEAEDREGEHGYVGSSEGVRPAGDTRQMEVCSRIGREEVVTSGEPQEGASGRVVDQTRDPRYDPMTIVTTSTSEFAPTSRAQSPTRAKKGKKEKEKEKEGHRTQIRRRHAQPLRKVGSTKQLANPPKPLYTTVPREFTHDGTLGAAETFRNEARYTPMAEHPRYSPAIEVRLPPATLTLSEMPKSEFDDDGVMADSTGPAHDYSASYGSSGMDSTQYHYRGEAVPAPYVDYHYPQHSYALSAPPPSPVYSHPHSPSFANPSHFGQPFGAHPPVPEYHAQQSMAGHHEPSPGWEGQNNMWQHQS